MKNNCKTASVFPGRKIVWPCLIILAGVAAYANSFYGVFILDDLAHITNNPRISGPADYKEFIVGDIRPFLTLSLAFNWFVSGSDPWSYHALNLVVHLAGGIVLYKVILLALTLYAKRNRGESGESADTKSGADAWIAGITALVWTVHPLQTESVTYVIQRAESMAGLCYLLVIYLALRSLDSDKNRRMLENLAVLISLIGVLIKETIVTAPFAVYLLQVFLSAGNGPRLPKTRFAGKLTISWALCALLHLLPHQSSSSMGFSLKKISAVSYFLTQPEIILHYLKLIFWPHPLVLDYGWKVVADWRDALLPLCVLAVVFCACLFLVVRKQVIGLPGILFFLFLAPSSSFYPLADLAFEHRVYLALAPVVFLVVLAVQSAGRKAAAHGRHHGAEEKAVTLPRISAVMAAIAVTAVFIELTALRNRQYASALLIWRDNVRHAPENPRAHSNLGQALAEKGRIMEAIEEYCTAIRLNPDSAVAHFNLGNSLVRINRNREACAHYLKAVELKPDYLVAHSNLAMLLARFNRIDQAIRHLLIAVRICPDDPKLLTNLGLMQARGGRLVEARNNLEQAYRLQPNALLVAYNLGILSLQQKKYREAVQWFERAVSISPQFIKGRVRLITLYRAMGQDARAEEQMRMVEAIRRKSAAGR